jgi:ribosomal protein S18 acetylase RimI-like enzyme
VISYRQPAHDDAAAVARLHAQSWRESYRGSFTDAYLDGDLDGERLEVWRGRLGSSPRDQFVELAVDGDDLVGFVCAYADHDPEWGSFVDNLHVSSASKRGGIGSELMRRAGSWLTERSPEAGVYLWVLEANATGRRFYENLGAHNAETTTMETHGDAIVRSCRYVWETARHLSAA